MDVFAAECGCTLVETRVDPAPKRTAYERSKQHAEAVCDEFIARGLPVVFMNCAAVYGPNPVLSGTNTLLTKVVHGEVPLLLPGGMPLLYSDGCARAHVAASDRGRPGERYLLADGHLRLDELAAAAAAAAAELRPGAPPVAVPPVAPSWVINPVASLTTFASRHLRLGAEPLVPKSFADFFQWDVRVDATKAQRELGFEPHGVADGVRDAMRFLAAEGFLRPVPQPDAAAPVCGRCSAAFSATLRRHHCRACGRVVCAACSAGAAPLPRLGYSRPERVCDGCRAALSSVQAP